MLWRSTSIVFQNLPAEKPCVYFNNLLDQNFILSSPNIRKIENHPDVQPSFEIDNLPIEIVKDIKYLGVQIDNRFNWDKHIQKTRTKAIQALGLIKYSKRFLKPAILNDMYRGLVEPHLSYCCSVWGCCSDTNISRLQKVQNRAARIVTNSKYDTSAMPLINGLGWATVKQLIFKESASLMYKSLNSLAPDYLSSLFTRCSDSNERNLRSTDLNLKIPLLKTKTGQKSFCYRGTTLWNSLDKASKSASSLGAFKNLI